MARPVGSHEGRGIPEDELTGRSRTRRPSALTFIFVAAIAACLLVTGSPALANGLPTTAILHGAGGSPVPAGDVPVIVEEEHLRIEMQPDDATVTVNAAYKLRNEGPSLSLTVAFPLPGGAYSQREQFPVRVSWGGRDVPFRWTVRPAAVAPSDIEVDVTWLDPFSGEAYIPPVRRAEPSPDFIEFELGLAAGATGQMVVEYEQFRSADHSFRFLEPVHRVDYLLRPARHWKRFGGLTIEVVTGPGLAVASRPRLAPLGDGVFAARFDALPDENLSVFVFPSPAPLGVQAASSWWRPWGRTSFLVLLAVGSGLARGLVRGVRGRAGVCAAWAVTATFAAAAVRALPRSLFGNSFESAIATWLLFLPCTVFVHLMVARLPRRPRTPSSGISGG
ncbi:MAG: hypothetical protein NUV93_08970 [Firmicutes bacterium]|jgi:hypothetical protein|nr:hypothetical protein [Bacillota bacterium]